MADARTWLRRHPALGAIMLVWAAILLLSLPQLYRMARCALRGQRYGCDVPASIVVVQDGFETRVVRTGGERCGCRTTTEGAEPNGSNAPSMQGPTNEQDGPR